MNWEISKPLVIAHRGATAKALENTLPAMEAALKMGVDGIETDLRITRDGQIVLFHDHDFQRLSETKGSVEKLTLNEIRKIRLRDGSSIPTLQELLELVKDKLLLNLELKTFSFFRPELERKTIEILKSFGLKDSILLSSFHPISLWRLRRLAMDYHCGYLFENKPLGRLAFYGLKHWIEPFSVHPPVSALTDAFVRKYREKIFVWTVNEESDMKRAIQLKINGIITDQPERLLRYLDRH